MIIDTLAKAGGLFACLTFIHFVVDWVFQSHTTAMKKARDNTARGIHCLIYTLGFVPFLALCHDSLTTIEWTICLLTLFVSHFIEDTYIPVMLWAKYIRKPPQWLPPQPWHNNSDHQKFLSFTQDSLGKILMIAIDQIIHLTFLWVLVYFLLN